MIKLGLTGGIGSGKTTISKIFAMQGIPVFYADIESKNLLDTSWLLRSKLSAVFGADIYLPNNTIDRKKFASLIFNNENLLKRANSIIHPEVHKHFYEWCNKQNKSMVLYEAAILFESGFYQEMHFNLLVTANVEERILRVAKRDNINPELVEERMKNQWSDEQKKGLADYIINNNGDEFVIPQVLEILERIKTHG